MWAMLCRQRSPPNERLHADHCCRKARHLGQCEKVKAILFRHKPRGHNVWDHLPHAYGSPPPPIIRAWETKSGPTRLFRKGDVCYMRKYVFILELSTNTKIVQSLGRKLHVHRRPSFAYLKLLVHLDERLLPPHLPRIQRKSDFFPALSNRHLEFSFARLLSPARQRHVAAPPVPVHKTQGSRGTVRVCVQCCRLHS